MVTKTRTVTLPTGNRLKVSMGLHKIGQQAPYFTITAEETTRRGRDVACGCLHEEILKAWPDLAPVVALHLSDAATGAPMHALENAWYWAGGTHWTAADPVILARHCRCTAEDAHRLIDTVRRGKPAFAAIIDGMCPRWAREAAEVIAQFELEVFE